MTELPAGFSSSGEYFCEVVSFLAGPEAAAMEHAELEERLQADSAELFRRLSQDHVDLRAEREPRLSMVADAKGIARSSIEARHARGLVMIFGEIEVSRLAYRNKGYPNLHPADGAFNLPDELHSHGLRRLAAIEASRGSFEEAADAVQRATGVTIGKRQVEALTARASVDVEEFYTSRLPQPDSVADGNVLVISADGKGIVMRPDSLRPATARAAAAATNKLECRLSKGEKRNRKRIAEVGAVYDVAPVPRSPADVLASKAGQAPPPAPKAKAKWVTASVVQDAAAVIAKVFDEAERRDPDHSRTWVALVDGANHQIDRINKEAKARQAQVTIVVDAIHVLEYLWGAVWCFFSEGDPAAEAWVRDRMLAILEGQAREVAAGVRRRATAAGLSKQKRKKADECATYLVNKADYLDYPTALTQGWPVASGVIEGTCRYLVADRMDVTGARWSVDGAEAVLKLRAVRANDDFSEYWKFHLTKERQRVHESRYANGTLPRAA